MLTDGNQAMKQNQKSPKPSTLIAQKDFRYSLDAQAKTSNTSRIPEGTTKNTYKFIQLVV